MSRVRRLTPFQMAKFLSRSDDYSRLVVDLYCLKHPLFAPSSSISMIAPQALAFYARFVATRRPSLTRFLLPVTRSVLQARHSPGAHNTNARGAKIGAKRGLVRAVAAPSL